MDLNKMKIVAIIGPCAQNIAMEAIIKTIESLDAVILIQPQLGVSIEQLQHKHQISNQVFRDIIEPIKIHNYHDVMEQEVYFKPIYHSVNPHNRKKGGRKCSNRDLSRNFKNYRRK